MIDVVVGECVGDSVDRQGMRSMQRKAYKLWKVPFLMIKSPPASGKSRGLMFIALAKLRDGDVSKVIVAVPEVSIGASFRPQNLTAAGFHTDWELKDRWNLCTSSSSGKVKSVGEFLDSPDTILVCTHATLRAAVSKFGVDRFKGCLVAIDEFHHVSESEDSKLGEVCSSLINHGGIHVIAMTGSYFRGDKANILPKMIEDKFKCVTYSYYEQLAANKYLKKLEIREAFYTTDYFSVLKDVIDPRLKTIIHIPSVNSAASTKDKPKELARVFESIGELVGDGLAPGMYKVKGKDGRILNVVDLVTDDSTRVKTLAALRDAAILSKVDIIIALNLAKEGFDWPACEHALTIGYRGSLVELIQIIGRATRDYEGKTMARFTQLVAKPAADMGDVLEAVNDMLKSIACSLLMEMAFTRPLYFKTKNTGGNDTAQSGSDNSAEADATPPAAPSGVQATVIAISGLKHTTSERVANFIKNDMHDLGASVLRNREIGLRLSSNRPKDIKYVNKTLIPRVIAETYPQWTKEEVEVASQHILASFILRRQGVVVESAGRTKIKLPSGMVDIDELSIDLIESVNPFHDAYDIFSVQFDAITLSVIHGAINAGKAGEPTPEELVAAFKEVTQFTHQMGRDPNRNSLDPDEARLGNLQDQIRKVKQRMRDEMAKDQES